MERVLLEEEGPVLRRYRVEGKIADLPFVQRFTAIPDLRRIDLETEIDLGSGRHLGPQLSDHRPELACYLQDHLKLCLNFESEFPRSFSDSPFLLAETRGPRITAGSFLGLEGKEGSCLAIHHRGTPGWHLAGESGLARNVLGWGPAQWLYASGEPIEAFLDGDLAVDAGVSLRLKEQPSSEWPRLRPWGIQTLRLCPARERI